jgi:benzoylformate decarboxylase
VTDARQIAFAPFLTGHDLDRLAGTYPIWSSIPACAQDVPGTIARAWHEARTCRGPALVVVPMGDWLEPARDDAAAPARLLKQALPSPDEVDEIAALIDKAERPAIVVGAGADGAAGWAGVVALAERLGCPIWQESFCSRIGFPQDHPQFAADHALDLAARRRRAHARLRRRHREGAALDQGAGDRHAGREGPLLPARGRGLGVPVHPQRGAPRDPRGLGPLRRRRREPDRHRFIDAAVKELLRV